jgi:undecaprenyl diphosphate synthase
MLFELNNSFKARRMKKKINWKDMLPKHIAIMMDGNGRWATKRGLPRTAGILQE